MSVFIFFMFFIYFVEESLFSCLTQIITSPLFILLLYLVGKMWSVRNFLLINVLWEKNALSRVSELFMTKNSQKKIMNIECLKKSRNSIQFLNFKSFKLTVCQIIGKLVATKDLNSIGIEILMVLSLRCTIHFSTLLVYWTSVCKSHGPQY